MIWLDDRLIDDLGGGAVDMARIFAIEGEVFREPPGARRRTLRFEAGGHGYFLKLHFGVGWREIFKNLFSLRLPVLGARNEWRAIQRLDELGVETMHLAGYGESGWNPARRRSFVITRELRDCISLEDYCVDWPNNPPPLRQKWLLIRHVAEMTARLHAHGINHRDLYICHFLLQQPWSGDSASLHLHLIDLHRVQIRRRTPRRWRVKDLAALYFSALDIGLTRRDLWRFVRWYTAASPGVDAGGPLWRQVASRAHRLARRRPVVRSEEGHG